MKMAPSPHFKGWPNTAGFDAHIEQPTPIELEVQGTIPAFVAGVLYRTGPGNHTINDSSFRCHHWFDGFSHLYRFDLIPQADGSCKVFYRSRRQVDALIQHARETGRMEGITFAQKRDPCDGLFKKFKAVFQPAHNPNPEMNNIGVTVIPNVPGMGEDLSVDDFEVARLKNLVGTSDHALVVKIDPESLQPLGLVDQSELHPELTGPFAAAHAHVDHETGDIYNFNLFVRGKCVYRVFKTSMATGETEVLATIAAPEIKPAYIHSFFFTADFIVLGIWSSHLAKGGVQVLWERNVIDAIMPFSEDQKTQWLVVDRKYGKGLVARFEGPAAFSFHSVNSWQEKREDGKIDIFCETVEYPNTDIIHRFYYENMISTGKGAAEHSGANCAAVRGNLVRYRLGGITPPIELNRPQPSAASMRPLPVEITLRLGRDKIGELPVFNPRFTTRKSRYIYSIIDRGLSSFVDGIVKTDTETGETKIWEQEHHTPGESIFIPWRDDDGTESTREDHGVLLTVILDGDRGTSYLLCLNATDMTELGRAEVPVAVGLGFHGQHVPSRRSWSRGA